MKKNNIRASVIGLGFGETHLKALNKNKFCDVIKVCDNNRSKKNILKKSLKKNLQIITMK